jgi:hypothetical protein
MQGQQLLQLQAICGTCATPQDMSATMAAKKRKKPGPPRTTGPGEQVKLRCHADFLRDVDAWIARNGGNISRQRAIMMLARLGLESFGK